jgi:hypothetical protein
MRVLMRSAAFARRLLLTTLLGILGLSVTLGLLVDSRLFVGVVVAPVSWVLVIVASWSHVRYRSKVEAWERARSEAWDRQEQASRERSSAELHEELERQDYVVLESQRARRRKRDGRA